MAQHVKKFPSLLALCATALSALIATAFAAPALAQSTPAGKTVSIISPFPPGGISDVIARVAAPMLAKSTGQTVIVENITGVSGTLAANRMFSATDGTQIMLVSPSETLMPPLLYSSVKWKSEDFRLLVNGPSVPLGLLVRANLPVKNVEELIAYAKNPANKPLSYASFGNGSIPHMAAEHFSRLTGVQMIHIPYRGGAPVTQDLIGGQVDVSFFPVAGAAVQLVETGRVKHLGYAYGKDLPTHAKHARLTNHPMLKDFVHVAWQSVAVPKATPAPVVDALAKEFATIFNSPEMKELAAKSGSVIPETAPLAQIDAAYIAEIARARALARAIGIQAQ